MSYNSKGKEQFLKERMSTYVSDEVEGTGAMNDAVAEPLPEDFEVKVLAELSRTVKDRVP